MKASVWFWAFAAILLCNSQFLCAARRQRDDEPFLPNLAPLDIIKERLLLEIQKKQDDVFYRNRDVSLSIEDPFYIIRERLLMEIRRRLIERNQKILDQIG